MTFLRAIKQLLYVALVLFVAAMIVLANEAYYVLEDSRKLIAKTTDAVDESRGAIAESTKAISDTSKMVNANLIHLDLILGRAERVSVAKRLTGR
jgi:hypothetical protein